MFRRTLVATILTFALAAACTTARAQSTTDVDFFNPLPTQTADFYTELSAFLAREAANRFNQIFSPFIVQGGLHPTAAGKVGTFTTTPLVAYPSGFRVNETAATIDYATAGATDNDTCFLAVDMFTTGNDANFVRIAGTHYLADCTSAPTPAPPTNGLNIAQVTIVAGAITAVVDIRVTSPIVSVSSIAITGPDTVAGVLINNGSGVFFKRDITGDIGIDVSGKATIGANKVGATQLSPLAVGTPELKDSAVTRAKMVDTVVLWTACATYTASGTFVVPADITQILARVWGGGGGGGSGNGTLGGGGGGGSAYVEELLAVTPAATLTVTVGTGGIGGAAGGNAGLIGTASNVTGLSCTATPGAPGNAGGTSDAIGGAGGVPACAVIGHIGGDGFPGTTAGVSGGNGGNAAAGGGGGQGARSTFSGTDGARGGGGGGGSKDIGATGGDGGDGYVAICY